MSLPEQLSAALKNYDRAMAHMETATQMKDEARSFLHHQVGEAIRSGVPFSEITAAHKWGRSFIDAVLRDWQRAHGGDL